jgi:hypothetical protein
VYTRRSAFAAVSLAVLLAGCVVHHHDHDRNHGSPGRGYGPPPHAPAHGYRSKYHDHDLRFDSGLGVYVVVDMPDVFFLDDRWYRWYPDRWEYAVGPRGPWRVIEIERLPGQLHKHKFKGNGNGHGNGKAKGKYK